MPFLQSSGSISISDIRNLFGGPSSPSLANYYRGGAYIPSTKTVSTTVREPSSGEYYDNGWTTYVWMIMTTASKQVRWNSAVVANPADNSVTSISAGGYTYYRGTLRYTQSGSYGISNYYYGVYRTSGSTTTTNINTNIPTSGTISLSNFYGAEKP
jgi:hypothetical protein